jgi:chromate transporter
MRESSGDIAELARLFLKLGTLGFGGPAAHVALMEEEVVRRRGWLTAEEFLDLVGAVNLLPGPNSTELAIAIGRRRGGTAGLLVAGICFILPSTLLVLASAWAYRKFGRLPVVEGLWRGVKPVVVAVVAVALVRFAISAVRSRELVAVAALALGLAAAGVHELLVLLLGGLAAIAFRFPRRSISAGAVILPFVWVSAGADGPGLGRLFLFFLQVGATLYGSGYVLLSYLRQGLVQRGGWLTEAELLDAVAIGQITPGPVSTTATFVGYLLAGVPGGLVATVGIFLPAFLLVGVSAALLARVRASATLRALLDGVNVGALALMAAVTWQLGRAAVDGWETLLVGVTSLALLWAGINSAWLIAAGAAAGLLLF